jgi:exonuclease VII large subunit
MAASSPLFAQGTADEAAQLRRKVKQLEQQVQQLEQELKPLKEQQVAQSRQRALRERFEKKVAQDKQKYTEEQLVEAENLYEAIERKWNFPNQATEIYQALLKKYPGVNRIGCAALDLAEWVKAASADERQNYLKDCIEKYSECFYGDGVQVGAYARFVLAQDCRSRGEEKKAAALLSEIKAKYADSIDHRGNLLVECPLNS